MFVNVVTVVTFIVPEIGHSLYHKKHVFTKLCGDFAAKPHSLAG